MTIVSHKRLQDHPQEFFRLLNLPLPVRENHEHYLDMWICHDEFMPANIREYNQYLDWCKENGYKSPQSYKGDHALPAFLNWARESCTLDSLVLMEESKYKFSQLDRRAQFKGQLLLSIDMMKANFSVMKLVAFQRDILIPETWEQLCEHLGIHPFLANSKTFRQYCFGSYEPGKCAAIQKHVIAKLVHHLNVPEDELVYISHDEVIIKYPEKGGAGEILGRINEIFGLTSCIKFRLTPFRNTSVYDVVLKRNIDPDLQAQLTEAREKKFSVVKEQRYEEAAILREKERSIMKKIQDHYERQMEEQCQGEGADPAYSLRIEYGMKSGELQERKKVLVGVPTNKFYYYFRSMLLREPVEHKDLLFQQDGMLAKWVLSEVEK